MATTTLLALVQLTADRLGLRETATLTGTQTSTTAVDSTNLANYGVDELREGWVVLTSGTKASDASALVLGTNAGIDHARKIASNAPSNTSLTLASAWTATPAAGSVIDIYRAPANPRQLRTAVQTAKETISRDVANYSYALYRPSRLAEQVVLAATQLSVTAVRLGPTEWVSNNDFRSGTTGWTFGSGCSLANDSSVLNYTRALKHANTNTSTKDVTVTAGETFIAGGGLLLSSGTSCTLTLTWLDTAGAALGSAITLGSVTTTGTLTDVRTERLTAPENAASARFSFAAAAASTAYLTYVTLYPNAPFVALSFLENFDGQSRYLTLPYAPDRDVRVEGKLAWGTLSADGDTLAIGNTGDLPRLFAAAAAMHFCEQFEDQLAAQGRANSYAKWASTYREEKWRLVPARQGTLNTLLSAQSRPRWGRG